MITTRFLAIQDFELYGDWLRQQSPETLRDYFGINVSPTFINSLMDGILSNPEEHYFLVAFYNHDWAGLIHMARISEKDMEFGVMVTEKYRHQGVANTLMSEAITWIRNRNYSSLYLHCLNRNTAMKHLAEKHGLELREDMGDIEAKTHVPPPSVLTYMAEAYTANKNIFYLNLQQIWRPFIEIAG